MGKIGRQTMTVATKDWRLKRVGSARDFAALSQTQGPQQGSQTAPAECPEGPGTAPAASSGSGSKRGWGLWCGGMGRGWEQDIKQGFGGGGLTWNWIPMSPQPFHTPGVGVLRLRVDELR